MSGEDAPALAKLGILVRSLREHARDPDYLTPGIAPDGGRRVGPYRLVRELGHGGMGAVFLAVRDDDAFQKRVAVKVLKRGMDTDAIVRRFRNERQILAGLDHPNIARLIDGGTTEDGLPYFVMEYVDGSPLTEYCEQRQLDTTARLDLFQQVCAAVQYAHQNLIIHRDIKPANVLVTGDGQPKLLDFGIAKLLNPELTGHTMVPTAHGLQLMTPEYASPEQVRGELVTTASDIYSLGVLLYEVLTGRHPYPLTSRSPSDIARLVCETMPAPPSTAITRTGDDPARAESGPRSGARTTRLDAAEAQRLKRRLEGDLDTIVLKALSKEPPRRYASADQLAEDIRRHLAGLPVMARKDTIGYRVSKFVRRNRAAVLAAAGVVVALVAGIVGVAWQARAARAERARAEQRFEDVRALANAFLFELHDAIRDLPGSTPARQLVVAKGMAYLDKLALDTGDRPDLQRELAAGYVKVGDVQGRPFNPNLGDTAGAIASYEKAVSRYEALGVNPASDAALRREAATAYLRLSEALSVSGEATRALALARQSLDLQRDVATDPSAPPEARRGLAVSYNRIGDMLSATGDTRGALEYRRLTLAVMERLLAESPADVDNLRQAGTAYQRLGNSLGNPNYPNVGDHAGGLEQMEKSIEVLSRATELHPTNALFRRNLAVATSNAADILRALKRTDEALARERQALAIFEAQVEEDPTNASARNDFAIGLYKIAEMQDGLGQTREALALYQRALDIHRTLAEADPDNDRLELEIASDHAAVGTVQAKLGQREAAIGSHTRAVEMSRALSAANGGDVELRVAVALALIGRADALASFSGKTPAAAPREDRAAAIRDYREAVGILEALRDKGSIAGTDLETLERAREALGRLSD